MTTSELVLQGCAPVPLAGYLKALGVFRLVAEQADPDAKGFWRDERFVLRTKLSKTQVVDFFLNDYTPTPVISPWNGGSGFYLREGKTKVTDPATGKRIKSGVRDEATTATRTLDKVLNSTAPRLQLYRRAAQLAKDILSLRKLYAAPDDREKADLIRNLRSAMPDEVVHWIDAAATVTQLDVEFPPLLGSGGNDGNLDFSTTLIQALLALMDAGNGKPTPAAVTLLGTTLFGEVAQVAASTAIGQFAPNAIGGLNFGIGFEGAGSGNTWETVLAIEGALVMASALVRRMSVHDAREASFPFMMSRRGAFGAGAGHISPSDEHTARGEFWAPIWGRPASLHELLALFREGRAVVDQKIVGNALDFARAVSQLGVDRGISHFERFAFEQRYGNMYLGVPLRRHTVQRNLRSGLIADLEVGGWLARARRAVGGKNAPTNLVTLGRQFNEVLFRLTEDGSHDAVQEALIAIGALGLETGRRPKLREILPPPPRLSAAWVEAADDGSYEFALAAALASLNAATEDGAFRLPFRSHLGPLGWPKGRESWDDTTESQAFAVWTGRNLSRDMGATLERRMTEAQRRQFVSGKEPVLPLLGQRTAPLAATAAFLADHTDDDRIAALSAGLAWARSHIGSGASSERQDALPFAYVALKPLFNPQGISFRDEARRFVDPLPLVRLLRAGRAHDAVSLAQRLARGAGLPAPFGSLDPIPTKPARLAAALLFPIAPKAYDRLIERAYPSLTREEDETDDA